MTRPAARVGRDPWKLCGAALLLVWSASGHAVADSAPPPAEPYLQAMSADLLPRLERERYLVLPRDDAAPERAQGLVLFSEPCVQVWRLLSQTERQREYRKELADLTNVERSGNVVVDRHHISVLFVRIVYNLRYELDPSAWHIEWALAPSYENGMQQVSGSWDLYDLRGDRTLGRLTSTVRVGSALPESMQDSMTRHKVPEVLDSVRQWVDSRGQWRP